jgi:hypothetical protein
MMGSCAEGRRTWVMCWGRDTWWLKVLAFFFEHGQVLRYGGPGVIDFIHTRRIGANVSVVNFTTEGVALGFECAKFSSGKRLTTTGSMEIGLRLRAPAPESVMFRVHGRRDRGGSDGVCGGDGRQEGMIGGGDFGLLQLGIGRLLLVVTEGGRYLSRLVERLTSGTKFGVVTVTVVVDRPVRERWRRPRSQRTWMRMTGTRIFRCRARRCCVMRGRCRLDGLEKTQPPWSSAKNDSRTTS